MTELLQYSFFQHALLGSLLTAVACGIVGTYIVARRLVFISGGITHASFGGLGLGFYLGMNPIGMAMVFAVLSAFGVEWASRSQSVREDSAIAAVWSLGMALGVIFIFLTPGYAPNLTAYLFGNILTITQGDLVEYLYDSRPLGILVSCIGVAFLLPYLQLQLTALGLIVEVTSLGAIPRVYAMVIAFVMVALFVFLSGLKGVASTAVVKDVMMMGSMLFFGLYLPYHYCGGIGEMFAQVEAMKPGFMMFPGGTGNLDIIWAMTTLVVMAAGFYMWPHFSTNTFSAKDPDVPRHNAVWLPVCHLFLIFPMIVGFTAVLVYADNPIPVADMAFLYMVKDSFPVWVLGIIGGAGALACMIPAADLLLSTSLLISRNIYIKGLRRGDEGISPEQMKRTARYLILILTAAALYLGNNNPLPLQDRDVVETIQELCQQVEGPASLLGLELRFLCSKNQHICAFHPAALELLTHQLLSNALKFTPAGGTVTVELKFHTKRVLLSVEDTGCGIPPEHLEALFDRYLHGDPLSPAPQGLGLGLSLCRRIAEGHGGTIMAESVVGKGSRFTLAIPDQKIGSGGVSDIALDYSGGFNRTLLALADALPAKAFLLRNES